jgi:uncharacterized protein
VETIDVLDASEHDRQPIAIFSRPNPSQCAKRIWIDLDNSPHVPLFKPIIQELQKRGFEVLLTARDAYQVCDLLKLHQLPCTVVGGHYGKNKLLKVLGTCWRTLQLLPLARKARPDLALSHGSRAQVLASLSLGIPTVLMSDYEYCTETGFLEPNWIITPEVIPTIKMKRARTLQYPGLKEDVYVPQFEPDASVLEKLGVPDNVVLVTLRPPATEAHYHNPESEGLFSAVMDLCAGIEDVRVVLLPRNFRQAAELRRNWQNLVDSGKLIIPSFPVDGLNLIWFSDLVISGGGTMNREAAALEVPVYSIFRGKIGAVDSYLAAQGRLVLLESVADVKSKIKLVSRHKAAEMRIARPEALVRIVDHIVQIVGSESH